MAAGMPSVGRREWSRSDGLPLLPVAVIEADKLLLQTKLDDLDQAVATIARLQAVIAAEAHETERGGEDGTLKVMRARRTADEQNAELAVTARLRRKALSGDGVSLGMDERREARRAKEDMLTRAREDSRARHRSAGDSAWSGTDGAGGKRMDAPGIGPL